MSQALGLATHLLVFSYPREENLMSFETTLYTRLVTVAQSGRTISRDEVACLLDLDLATTEGRQALGHALDDLAFKENAAGRPLLSAVVVQPEIGYPTKDFFLLARELGLNTSGDDRSYYYFELKRVHSYWKQNQPIPAAIPLQAPAETPAVLALH
jgi:hypothetical protein